jgi:hypothetical protein
MGVCITDKASEPHVRIRVPCIIECIHNKSERSRKAGLDKVARVSGRNRRICRTVESLTEVIEMVRREFARRSTRLPSSGCHSTPKT